MCGCFKSRALVVINGCNIILQNARNRPQAESILGLFSALLQVAALFPLHHRYVIPLMLDRCDGV